MGLSLKMQHLHEVQNVMMMRWSYVLVLLVMSLCCNAPVVESLPNCSYPALYNFGDSLSDVGNAIAAFPTQFKHAEMAPNGYQFPMHGADRLSDGKLFVDFMGMIYVHSALFSCISLLKAFTLHPNNLTSGAAQSMSTEITMQASYLSPLKDARFMLRMKN